MAGRTGVSRFMGFPTIPMADEGSKAMGIKKKGKRRKIEPLPKLQWPLRPLISNEHEKRLPWLPWRKGEESRLTITDGGS